MPSITVDLIDDFLFVVRAAPNFGELFDSLALFCDGGVFLTVELPEQHNGCNFSKLIAIKPQDRGRRRFAF